MKLPGLSSRPFWTQPITQVGWLRLTTKNQLQHVARLRAQRDANAQFVSALSDRIGNYAVNADRRQQRRSKRYLQSSIFDPRSSVFDPRSSVFDPRSSVFIHSVKRPSDQRAMRVALANNSLPLRPPPITSRPAGMSPGHAAAIRRATRPLSSPPPAPAGFRPPDRWPATSWPRA